MMTPKIQGYLEYTSDETKKPWAKMFFVVCGKFLFMLKSQTKFVTNLQSCLFFDEATFVKMTEKYVLATYHLTENKIKEVGDKTWVLFNKKSSVVLRVNSMSRKEEWVKVLEA